MNDFIDDSIKASVHGGWLTKDTFSRKRHKAVQKFFLKAGAEVYRVLDALPPIAIFTRSLDSFGLASSMRSGPMIYLSPNLELESQKCVDFTFAHEVAHVALKHHVPGNEQMAITAERHEDRPAEKAADALAQSWGFKLPRAKPHLVKIIAELQNSGKKT